LIQDWLSITRNATRIIGSYIWDTILQYVDWRSHRNSAARSAAAIRLADLWICQGKRDQARKLLGPICESFAEELDTPDYKQAVELLHVLHA